MFQVVLRARMSISPDCSAVNRCGELRGMYFTFSESPKTGGRHGAADVDVEPLPFSLAVRGGKTGRGRIHAALHEAAGLHGVENGSGLGGK